ncbi:hypothetical protein G7Y89_g8446 [Cudoniella acicularis]|uniref:Uncharacterized protein n=1 Tax=Cudoniella acicularis TaxID=354080 RepID=A0A8H4RGM1_9HELO|nr:hypothetical protein G7Y89_g8446 [Cudoniella acicularis]
MGKLRPIETAVRLLGQAVEAAPPNHSEHGNFLRDQGYWGGYLYEPTGQIEVFAEALSACEEAVTLAPLRHENRAFFLVTLGNLLMKRYKREKTASDLDKIYNEAVSLTPPGHLYRMASLVALSESRTTKFKVTNAPEDINEAIRCCQEAEKTAMPEDSLAGCLSTLSACHLAKFETTQTPEDLDEAILAAKRAIEQSSTDARARDSLTKCFGSKFQQTQDLDDLKQAIRLGTQAAQEAEPVRLEWEKSLCILSDLQDAYFSKTGDRLYSCIVSHEQIVKILPPAEPARVRSLHRLCDIHYERYQNEKKPFLLEDAIKTGELCVETWAPAYPRKAQVLMQLSNCLADRLLAFFERKFVKFYNAKDLGKAIYYGEEAIKEMSPDDLLREEVLGKLRDLKVHGIYLESIKEPLEAQGVSQHSAVRTTDRYRALWENSTSFAKFRIDMFPTPDYPRLSGEDVEQGNDIKRRLLARKLKKHAGLKILPTDDLQCHLKLDKKSGVKILFPLADDEKSTAILGTLTSTHAFDPDCLRFDSTAILTAKEKNIQYHYFGKRLVGLYEEFENPTSRGFEKWFERKSGARYMMMATLAGVVLAIFLDLASLAKLGEVRFPKYEIKQRQVAASLRLSGSGHRAACALLELKKRDKTISIRLSKTTMETYGMSANNCTHLTKLQPNADISGIGVLSNFFATAYLSFICCIAKAVFDHKSSNATRPSPLLDCCSQAIQSAVVSFRDQEVVTGISTIIARLLQLHWQSIVNLA